MQKCRFLLEFKLSTFLLFLRFSSKLFWYLQKGAKIFPDEVTRIMSFVIVSPCVNEKAAECVAVCPVDCIKEGSDQYFIDPDTCIECGACVTACPVDAIYHEGDVPADQQEYIAKAVKFFTS
jgi:ferredoxin